jgi:hypothetical protein
MKMTFSPAESLQISSKVHIGGMQDCVVAINGVS